MQRCAYIRRCNRFDLPFEFFSIIKINYKLIKFDPLTHTHTQNKFFKSQISHKKTI